MFKFTGSSEMKQEDYNKLKLLVDAYGPDVVLAKLGKVCDANATITAGAVSWKDKLANAAYVGISRKVKEVLGVPDAAPSAPMEEEEMF